MIPCGTISATARTVGLNGFRAFTGFGYSRFLSPLVIGRTLMRGIPLSGGWVADSTPSRMATYSLNVGIVMPVGTPINLKNNKGGVTISTGRG